MNFLSRYQKASYQLVFTLFVFAITGHAQSEEQLFFRADSLSRSGATHLGDSIYVQLQDHPKTLFRFKSFLGQAENQLTYFKFEQAERSLKEAASLLNRIQEKADTEKGKYYFLLGSLNHYRSEFSAAKVAFLQAEEYFKKSPAQWRFLTELYLMQAQAQVRLNNPNLQKTYLDRAYTLLLAHDPPDELMGDASMQLARYYRLIGDWDAYLVQVEAAINYFHKAFGDIHHKIAFATQYQHYYYDQRGDLNAMLHVLERAQTILDQLFPYHEARLGQNAGQLSNCFRRLGRMDQAHLYIDLAIENLSQHLNGDEAPIIAGMYRQKAKIYEDQDSIKKSIVYIQKSQGILKKLGDRNGRARSRNMQTLARAYYAKGSLDSALYWNELDFITLMDRYGPDFPQLSETYRLAGSINIKEGRIKEGIAKLQLALEKAAPSFKALQWQDLPKSHQYQYIPPVLSILLTKAQALETLAKEDGKNKNYLKQAHRTYQSAIDLVDHLRSSYNEEDTKQLIQENADAIYRGAIASYIKLHHPLQRPTQKDSLLNMVNRSKALLLREALADQKARRFAGIPDSLIQHERALRSEISYLKYKDNRSTNPMQIAADKEKLVLLQQEMDQLFQSLKTNYPKYFALKYAEPRLQLTDLQQQLAKDQALVQYHLNEQLLVIALIQRDTHHFFLQDINADLGEMIQEFRRSISDFDYIRENRAEADQKYAGLGKQLYELLFVPFAAHLSAATKNLIIIPDGLLSYLPFEQLLQEMPKEIGDYPQYDYLFKDYIFSYAYSVDLWQQSRDNRRKTSNKLRLAAFAPSYQSQTSSVEEILSLLRSSNMQNLPGARKEAESVAKLFNGQAWLDKEATEAVFREHAKSYDILHLSMHGILNDENPMRSHLLFQQEDPSLVDSLNDNYLMMAELYGMQLEAEMAVLSACNSGVGELKSGEGLMSISRAFSYAGVQSIVMTLWAVSDHSTSDLMLRFYKNLKKGQSKALALQQAKLDYLKENNDPIFSHPYYWSGFVMTGDTSSFKTNSSYTYWLLGGILLLLSFFYWRSRKLQ